MATTADKYVAMTNDYVEAYINKDTMDPSDAYLLDALIESLNGIDTIEIKTKNLYLKSPHCTPKDIYGKVKSLHLKSFQKMMAPFDCKFKKIALMGILIGAIMVNGGNLVVSFDRGFMEFLYLFGFLLIFFGHRHGELHS